MRPLWCGGSHDEGTEYESSRWCVPPLISSYESWTDGRSETRLLLGLYGHDTATNKSGFWLWPLVSWSRDDDFASLEKMMNAETLDSSITGKVKSEICWNCRDMKSVTNEVFRTEGAVSSSKLRFGSGLFGTTRYISHDGGDNDHIYSWLWSSAKRAAGDEWRIGKERTVMFRDKTTFGNWITFGGEKTRVVNFDYDTKEKVFDGELDESCSLFGLLWSSRDEKIAGGHRYKKRALLWRLWHWEELNGDVSLDVFPGFTYDSRKDGYRKTSFLWRFFRYERDPEKGTAVDFLFIPVWR